MWLWGNKSFPSLAEIFHFKISYGNLFRNILKNINLRNLLIRNSNTGAGPISFVRYNERGGYAETNRFLLWLSLPSVEYLAQCSEELRPHLKPDFKILFTDLLDHCLSIRTGFFKLQHLQQVEYHTKSLKYQYLIPVFMYFLRDNFKNLNEIEIQARQKIAVQWARFCCSFLLVYSS